MLHRTDGLREFERAASRFTLPCEYSKCKSDKSSSLSSESLRDNSQSDHGYSSTDEDLWYEQGKKQAGSPSGKQEIGPQTQGQLGQTTKTEFRAQQQGYLEGKTTWGETEEEIVTEYLKKQSLLEIENRSTGEDGVVDIISQQNVDLDDEESQTLLKLNLRDSSPNRKNRLI
jgi:hypothetical protein